MLKAEATIANLPATERGPERVWYGSAAASEYHDMDWLSERLPDGSGIQINSLTNTHTVLIVAGPQARAGMDAAAPDRVTDRAAVAVAKRTAPARSAPSASAAAKPPL